MTTTSAAQVFSGLSDDEQQILDQADRFARQELYPLSARMDADEWWPAEAFPKIGATGYFGIPIPEAYGGAGLDLFASGLVLQAFARWNHALALSWVAHENLCLFNIFRNASEAQRQRYLPGLCSGQQHRRAGPHRARRRLRRHRLDAHHRHPRRRPLRAQRHQALHHQRPGRRRAAGLRQDQQGQGLQGRVGLHRRKRLPRLQGGAEAHQDGLSRQPDRRAGVRRLPRAGGQPGRRRRPRRAGGDERARPGARDGRAAVPGHLRARAGTVDRVRPHAQAVRPADRQLPDGAQQDRRHVCRGPNRRAS